MFRENVWMDVLWRLLSALSGLGLLLCYVSGFLSLVGVDFPELTGVVLRALVPLWFVTVVAHIYYGRGYSNAEFQNLCLWRGPGWVRLSLKVSFWAFITVFSFAALHWQNCPVAFCAAIFYNVMLATFVAVGPGGFTCTGKPGQPPPIPSPPRWVHRVIRPLVLVTAAAIVIEFAAQLIHLT